jgi:tetratricopeptide (TPR) repeat protein
MPKHDEAATLNARALEMRARGLVNEALACFTEAAALDPLSAEIRCHQAVTLHLLDRNAEAIAAFDASIAIADTLPDAHKGRGDALAALGRFDDAVAAYDASLKLRPDDAHTIYNRANALLRLGRYGAASEGCRRAIAISPTLAEPHAALGECLLVQGNFEDGWKEFEWRWRTPEMAAADRQWTTPRWCGNEDISGKTILVHAEQGLGDTIQFCRYVQKIAERGARAVLEVQPQLLPVLQTLRHAQDIVPAGARVAPHEFHVPMMSLPLAFGTRIESIPAAIPYLSADPQRVAAWRARLSPDARLRVGIAWSGNPSHLNDRNRSMAWETFAPLLEIKGIEFVSLQPMPSAPPSLKSWGSDLRDFGEIAALIEALDLVITVDTVFAHLAGALGKSVWILLSRAADWRWLEERSDSPWYPSAHLFRQSRLGDWQEVVATVAAELAASL